MHNFDSVRLSSDGFASLSVEGDLGCLDLLRGLLGLDAELLSNTLDGLR
jgi:hypothetical protein